CILSETAPSGLPEPQGTRLRARVPESSVRRIMTNRIWVVSELYFPETTSTGHFLTGIAEGLAKYYPVNVICSQPTYSARGIRAPIAEMKAGVNIFRAYSPLLDKNVLVFRFLNLLFFSATV